ncbi:unnamed protein product [Vitrella brassicaformis CCMP3155]|uniref:Uncharacterized protein n=1 Tax=Vitrella brassicaformis (strain CCMP3155) TaxID=1169540 RepID=A0A0G4EVL9_VITBC|nr:unnamed protein product [Vitrella brassicaformis CCMP3155]|eukprot:CEM02334.1 unnamed protein product [Vitrella brassicaformis CCMP3155]
MKKRQRLSAYCCYLRDDLPTQVSIAVKTALIMPFRATATASLPAEVFDYIQAFIGVPTPPTVSLPISQQLPFGRCINQMVNSYLSSAYQSIRETGTMEACGLGDLLDQVRQKAMEEGRRLGINVMSADKVKSHGLEAARLRRHLVELEANRTSDVAKTEEVRLALERLEADDPMWQYWVARRRMKDTAMRGAFQEAAINRDKAKAAKKALPQYQLSGLWVADYEGNSASRRLQLIKMAYEDDDTLVARKVIGDMHVPEGQVTFRVDVSQLPSLNPLSIPGQSVGTYVEALEGEGQVADPGHANAHFVAGRLILLGERTIAFGWVGGGVDRWVVFERLNDELLSEILRQHRRLHMTGE